MDTYIKKRYQNKLLCTTKSDRFYIHALSALMENDFLKLIALSISTKQKTSQKTLIIREKVYIIVECLLIHVFFLQKI